MPALWGLWERRRSSGPEVCTSGVGGGHVEPRDLMGTFRAMGKYERIAIELLESTFGDGFVQTTVASSRSDWTPAPVQWTGRSTVG